MIQCKRVFLHINVLDVPLLAQSTIRGGWEIVNLWAKDCNRNCILICN